MQKLFCLTWTTTWQQETKYFLELRKTTCKNKAVQPVVRGAALTFAKWQPAIGYIIVETKLDCLSSCDLLDSLHN